MGEIISLKNLALLVEAISSEGGMVAFLSACLVLSWFYLIRKFNQNLNDVKKDQEKCHKDREELKVINITLKQEIREARDMNRDLNRLNKESQQRIAEYQTSQNATSEMLRDVFDKMLEKLDK